MKVLYRLLIVSILLGAAFIAGFFVMQQSQRSRMTGVVTERHAEIQQLFQGIIDLEQQELHTIVFDYTYWDELVSFVQSRESNFAKNILDTSLEGYQINAIWVYDPDLKLVYATTNLPGNTAPPLPFSAQEIEQLFRSSYLAGFAFRLPDGMIMEVRGATIHPSADVAHQTELKGYFFAGRTLDTKRLAYLSKLTGAQVEILRADQMVAQKAAGGTLVIDSPILDQTGKPLAYVRGTFPNIILEGYLQAQQRDMAFYVFTTSIMLALVIAGLVIWVARPLSRISSSLASGDLGPVQTLQRDTSEFGNIARLMSEFFHQRKAMAEQIQLLEYTQAALQRSENRYRAFSELTSDATFSLLFFKTGEIQIEWGAETMARIAGFAPGELIDPAHLLGIIFPENIPDRNHRVTNLFEGIKQTHEYRIQTQSGEIRWVRIHLQPFENPQDPAGIRVHGAAQDITEQKAAAETFRTLVEHSLQGLAIFQNNRFVFANQVFLKMTGNTLEELGAMSNAEILARLDIPSSGPDQPQIAGFFAGKILTVKFKIRFLHKNDSWRWMDIFCEQVEYQGKPAIQAACMDITDQILSEEALQEQSDYSKMIFSSVGSPVLILTPGGRIADINPACQQLTGKHLAEVKDLPIWDLFRIPQTAPICAENFHKLVETLTIINGQEIELVRDDRVHWLSWSQHYMLDSDGQVAYILGSAVDITESVIHERQNEATAQIATALRGNLSREGTIHTLLQKVQDLLSADSVGIVFPLEDRDELLIEFCLGRLQESCQGKRLSLKDGPASQAWHSGCPSLNHHIVLDPNGKDPGNQVQPGSTAWIPLRIEGAALGMLLVTRHEQLNQADLDLLVKLSDMAAGTIERANRAEQDQRRVQQLSALQSIYLGIVTSLDLNFTLNMIVMQTTSQLGIDAVDIFLLNPQTQMLRFTVQSGFHSPEIEKTQLWLGESQAGRVAMERKSQHLYDPDGIASYFSPNDMLRDENFIAYDAVPLVVKGEVKGVIEAYHRAPYNVSGESQELLEALALLTAIAIDHSEIFEQLQRRNQDLRITFEATIESWARSLELWDFETNRHSVRVVTLTEKLAQWMGISGDQLTNIRRGALLHDIGKIGIPDRIYQKPGKLTPDEWAVIVNHPVKAYEILNNVPFLKPALDIVYGHHERWNGKGYPLGLSGEQIPLAARIFAVVDIFDALMSSRAYKEAWSEENALKYLKETAGIELDPKIVEAFLNMYPILKMSHLLDDLYPKEV